MFLAPTRRAGINRDVLNRRDRRLSGRTTWFPLTGHRRSIGDVSGEIATQSGVQFDPDPASGVRLRIEGNRNCSTGLTASTLGIGGSGTPWTIFWQHAHWGNLTGSSAFLFTVGDNGNGLNIEANCFNGGVRLGNWQQYVTVNPGLEPTATKSVRVVVTWDGAVFRMWLRAYNPLTQVWEAVLSGASASTSCNLSDAKALRFADNTAGAGGHSAWTGIGFWGLVARRCGATPSRRAPTPGNGWR